MDLYGSPVNGELHVDGGDERPRSTLEDLKMLAEHILPKRAGKCEIEIIPFEASLALAPTKHFKPEALVRIRISHVGSLDQLESRPEEEVLNAVMEKLEELRDAGGLS